MDMKTHGPYAGISRQNRPFSAAPPWESGENFHVMRK
jgi:hypothetical protein